MGSEQTAVLLTQAFAVTLFVFPSDSVIKAVGANGYVASLIGLAALGVWACALAFGLYDPFPRRNPIRIAFGLLWVSSLISYGLMSMFTQTPTVQLAGDRWMIQLAMLTGVAFIASDGIQTKEGVRRVVRAIVLAAAFCAVLAMLQYAFGIDLSRYLRMLPGFELNGVDGSAVGQRYGLTRAAGTALHPIELGVVSAMALPLALWLARFDQGRVAWRRWGPAGLILAASVLSVSRSGVVGLVVALCTLILLIPAKDRAVAVALVPLGLSAVLVSVPGYLRTMLDFFVAGGTGSDSSVQARTDDYSMVASQLADRPYFGQGPGRFVPANALEILDNQYLATTIDLGLVGLAALLVFMAMPATMALSVRRRTGDPELRWLCAALAGSALAAAACTFTFDSFSFPQFAGMQALVAGLAGVCWAQAPIERRVRTL